MLRRRGVRLAWEQLAESASAVGHRHVTFFGSSPLVAASRTAARQTRPYSSSRSRGGTLNLASEAAAARQQQQQAAAVSAAATAHALPLLRASTPISDVLSVYQADGRTFTCLASNSLYEASQIMLEARVGCLVAMEDDGEHVAGLVTERDLLTALARAQERFNKKENKADSSSSSSSSDPTTDPSYYFTHTPVSSAMTPAREMVHIRPTDRVDEALSLMTSQGFRHLPVLESEREADGTSQPSNHLRGMVSMRNLVDVIFRPTDAGGKAQFLTDILPRIGVPKNTALRKKQNAGTEATPYPSLYLNAGVCSIPHPDKKFGEDSFVAMLTNVHEGAAPEEQASHDVIRHPLSTLAVFDGVGSWSFEKGLDPARFSNQLAQALKDFIVQHPTLEVNAKKAAENNLGVDAPKPANAVPIAVASDAVSPPSSDALSPALTPATAPLSPSSMLAACWNNVISHQVVGSSTACILSLDHRGNELRAVNIGDSGFLVLRHRDVQAQRALGAVGASLAQMEGPAYQVVYRSPQQLHYFNCPLQIGIGAKGETDSFESPVDADLLSVPVLEGDIIVLATDGLFDNVHEEMIVEEVSNRVEQLEKEEDEAAAAAAAVTVSTAALGQSNPPDGFSLLRAPPTPSCFVSGSATTQPTSIGSPSPLQPVAKALVDLALKLSLDKMTDSPFAVLAKEHNILWKNGGRKDDITVIVARVETIPPTPHTGHTHSH